MHPKLRKWLPALVLGAGVLATTGLVAVRPSAQTRRSQVTPALVRVLVAEPGPVRVNVVAQGNVEPRTEADLVSEVSGRVIWTAPGLEAGGFFDADDVLARLDDAEYRAAAERARAAVERAASRLSLAEATLGRRQRLQDAGAASGAALDEAESQARVARADLRDARAALVRAELDLARTEIRAPFEGRTRRANVDVGQFVTRGAPVARIFAVDYAEIRLPIPDEELAFLDVRLGAAPEEPAAAEGSLVSIRGRFAGREHVWEGRLVGTEGALDPKTRMVTAVVRVERPYGGGAGEAAADARAPLPVGLFVEAEIEGRAFESVTPLPRAALRGRDQVVVVDEESRLRLRKVELLRVDGERVWVSAGLAPGERVCVSPLDLVVDGTLVRVLEQDAAEAREARS